MPIEDLVPKLLHDRYGTDSLNVLYDIAATLRGSSPERIFHALDIKRIYFNTLKRYNGIASQLQGLLAEDRTAKKKSINVIDFHDLYKLDGNPTGQYKILAGRIDGEAEELMQFLVRKGVLVDVPGKRGEYHVNKKKYIDAYLAQLGESTGNKKSVRTPKARGRR